MGKMERTAISHSVNDVIMVLENQPVRHDWAPGWTEVQVMNRVSIAHLSIERAMKFIIMEAGGPLTKNHDLPSRLKELRQHEPESANFLEKAFQEAVQHYRYNANATQMKHLKSLDSYLATTGSDESFQDIRYWELIQSPNEMILRTIYLTLHMELLHAMSEILLAPERPKDTVSTRVEWAVRDAMFSKRELSYPQGSDKEQSVKAYIKWLRGFGSVSEAMTQASKGKMPDGDGFIKKILEEAYEEVSKSKDPAVRYFAETLAVLPKQQRDAIPCVEWLGPDPYQHGRVFTPGGDTLGFTDRRLDGMWAITPSGNGPIAVTAIADSQTDARSHLADLLTRKAKVTVRNEERELRIVGKEHDLFKRNYNQLHKQLDGMEGVEEPTFQVRFWGDSHNLTVSDAVRIEAANKRSESIVSILEGTVTRVKGHEVYVQGREYFDSVC